jgi:hypothetical protein
MDSKWTAVRVLTGIVALPFTYLALTTLLGQVLGGVSLFGLIILLAASSASIIFWSLALRGHIENSRARAGRSLAGGVIVGGIALIAGFFGPVLFGGDNPQGPLVGIFLTGPLGFTVGSVIAYLWTGRMRLLKRGNKNRP